MIQLVNEDSHILVLPLICTIELATEARLLSPPPLRTQRLP